MTLTLFDTELGGWVRPREGQAAPPGGQLSSPILPPVSDIIQWAGMEMEIVAGRKTPSYRSGNL